MGREGPLAWLFLAACGGPPAGTDSATGTGDASTGATTTTDTDGGTPTTSTASGASGTASSGSTGVATTEAITSTSATTTTDTSPTTGDTTTTEPGDTTTTEPGDTTTTEPGDTTTTGNTTTTTTGDTGSTSEPACPEGTEGCPCLPGDACDQDLVCTNGTCVPGQPVVCGDGVVTPGELCDDGNGVDHDGCTTQCTPTKVLAVETSAFNTCALLSGGAVRCWGGGVAAQKGYPNIDQVTIGDDEHPSAFGPVQLGEPAVAIGMGGNHTCVLLASGAVRCFGDHQYGKLGLGPLVNQHIGDNEYPTDVAPVKLGGPAIAIASYDDHNCVVLAGGSVRCWARNDDGELGLGHVNNIGDNEHPDSQPTVMLGSLATGVAAGLSHSCALLASKQVRCWGSNQSGEIGLGYAGVIGNNEHPNSVPPLAFTDIAKVVAGTYHTCLLRAGGEVRCFGNNGSGQLGLGHKNNIGDGESPDVGPIALGGPAIDIDAGGSHTCAVLLGGDVRCWGLNGKGQLGLGHTTMIGDDELPTAVPPIKLGGLAVRVSASRFHTCALLAGGSIRCWGEGIYGALGYANKTIIGDNEHPEVAGDVKVWD